MSAKLQDGLLPCSEVVTVSTAKHDRIRRGIASPVVDGHRPQTDDFGAVAFNDERGFFVDANPDSSRSE